MKTTVIGALPKPQYLTMADWFQHIDKSTKSRHSGYNPSFYTDTKWDDEDSYYKDTRSFCDDFASCVNRELVALAQAGCKYVQVDDPVLIRQPDDAREFGLECLEKCFQNVPNDVTKIVHVCCGYPDYLDQEDYLKADPEEYFNIIDHIDRMGFVDQISVEDAHRRNRNELFRLFRSTSCILGVVKIASSKVETVQEIQDRVKAIANTLPLDKITLAPDCGLGFLPMNLIEQKVRNMVEAAKTF